MIKRLITAKHGEHNRINKEKICLATDDQHQHRNQEVLPESTCVQSVSYSECRAPGDHLDCR